MSYIVGLLRRFKQGDQEAFEEILTDANPFVRNMISKYAKNKYVRKDHNEDDIKSVVYETIFKVCMKFDFERFTDGIKTADDIGHEKKYYALLRREMKNRMVYEVFKWGGDKKYKNMRRCHNTISLETKIKTSEDEVSFKDLFSNSDSPVQTVIENEIREKISTKLQGVCKSVFDLRLEGYNISEISRKLNISTVSVTNALQFQIIPAYQTVAV